MSYDHMILFSPFMMFFRRHDFLPDFLKTIASNHFPFEKTLPLLQSQRHPRPRGHGSFSQQVRRQLHMAAGTGQHQQRNACPRLTTETDTNTQNIKISYKYNMWLACSFSNDQDTTAMHLADPPSRHGLVMHPSRGGTFARDSSSLEPAFVTWNAKKKAGFKAICHPDMQNTTSIYTYSAQPLTTQDREIDRLIPTTQTKMNGKCKRSSSCSEKCQAMITRIPNDTGFSRSVENGALLKRIQEISNQKLPDSLSGCPLLDPCLGSR